MASSIQVAAATKQAKSEATKAKIDTGSGPGRIDFYTSPRTAIDAAVTATLIASITLNDPCGTVDATGLHLTSATPGQVVSAGIIAWGRVVDSDGHPVFSGTALQIDDPLASTAAFKLDKIDVLLGSFISLAQADLAEGG